MRAACERHLRDLKEGHKRGLTFDVEAADRFFRFFRTVLRLSDGQFDDLPFELHPSQKFIVGSHLRVEARRRHEAVPARLHRTG